MGLILLAVLVSRFPENVGTTESVPAGPNWSSSTVATVVQGCCGFGSGAVVAGAGFALMMGAMVHEDWDDARTGLAITAALVPAATATGVVLAGRGRGRAGKAYLGSYLGAVALGTVGFAATRVFGGDPGSGALIGSAVGSLPGAVVGYNLTRQATGAGRAFFDRFGPPALSLRQVQRGSRHVLFDIRLLEAEF